MVLVARGRRDLPVIPAIMAAQAALVQVVSECDIAVGTVDGLSAAGAKEETVKAAAIQEKNGLVPGLKVFPDRVEQSGADNPSCVIQVLIPLHVNHFHRRQRSVLDPDGHGDEMIPPGLTILVGLNRRGAGPEQNREVLRARPHHGRVAGLVARSCILLVGVVVLLVNDDQAEPRERGKERGTRTDHQVHGPACHPHPLIIPLPGAKATVISRHPVPEPRPKKAFHIKRERDLRNDQNDLLAQSHGRFRRPEIDLRLSAPRDAVKE
jgi:hypothetical protein